MESFPLLNIWSAYSLLQSSWDMTRGVTELAEAGYGAAGLADYQTLAGGEQFARLGRSIHMETWVGVSVPVFVGAQNFVASLYACDPQGWQDLCALALRPRIHNLERVGSPHLLVVLPSMDKPLWDRVWPIIRQLELGGLVEELNPEDPGHGGLWVPSCPVRFNHHQGIDAYRALVAMGEYAPGSQVSDIRKPSELLAGYPEAMRRRLFDWPAPEVLPRAHYRLPVVWGSGEEDARRLAADVQEGLRAWAPEPQEDYQARLAHELSVIADLGFASYFLIVADLVRYARTRGILTGPGRGSAAGSLVARCLGITRIDPLAYGLLFERFLNPHRNNMPDIDLDVDFSKRYQLIEYLRERWGHDRVAQIGTYGTLGARAVLREVARVLNLPADSVNAVMDKWRTSPGSQLADIPQDILAEMNQVDSSGRWPRVSLALEGLPHHISVHAAGVVLSDVPLLQILPCSEGTEGNFVTQMNMTSVENMGLLKLDVLGLRALAVADRVQRVRGDQFETVDLTDPETLELLGQAETDAVFQLDGRGVKEILKHMKPRSGAEIIDVVALYRPGPMDTIGTYLARRAGREPLSPDIFAEVCADTYGVMVYQEQLMTLVQRVAGYSLAEADLFRRAISKKDHAKLGDMGKEFMRRAINDGGWSGDWTQTLWNRILAFADYGFNKSHAAAYGLFSYYMAFLKAHYPLDFWAAEFSTIGSERLAAEMMSAVSQGIVVLPPDVTCSGVDFTAQPNGAGIQAGLTLVRGVNPNAAAVIVAEREGGGPYQSRTEAFQRIAAVTDPRIARTLAEAGSMSRLPGTLNTSSQLSLFADSLPGQPSPERVNAELSFGFAWPVAVGPIYVRVSQKEDVSWWQDHLHNVHENFPGACAVIVGKERAPGYQVEGIRLAGNWESIRAVRRLPHVMGCGRQIVKKRGWNDVEDLTRGAD